MSQRPPGHIERYDAATRINHWIVAISFVLLALSGLALFHPAMFWLTNLFGGGPWTRILHPFIGCFMVAAFSLLGVKFWRENTAAAARLDLAAQNQRGGRITAKKTSPKSAATTAAKSSCSSSSSVAWLVCCCPAS